MQHLFLRVPGVICLPPSCLRLLSNTCLSLLSNTYNVVHPSADLGDSAAIVERRRLGMLYGSALQEIAQDMPVCEPETYRQDRAGGAGRPYD